MGSTIDKTPKPVAQVTRPGYPSRREMDEQPPSPGRRRFLRQVGQTAGGIGLLSALGLGRLAHGQSREVDFSVLDAHPDRAAAAPPSPADSPAPPGLAPPARPAAAAPPRPAQELVPSEEVASVTENRALWIEPGYLVLIRWERPTARVDLVDALEGSTPELQSYLRGNISQLDDLHDLTRLHTHEDAVAQIIEARIAPATLQTLHLDHDCNQVCSSMGWTREPEHIPLPGMMPAPSR